MNDMRRNTYDEADLKSVVDEIEGHEAEKEKIMAAARGECAGIAKKIEALKKRANAELMIPTKPLNALLKTRKLEKQLKEVAEGVDNEEVEVFEDMTGQLSFLKPVEGEPVQTAAQIAAAQRRKEADEQEEIEHQEGANVLNSLATVQ